MGKKARAREKAKQQAKRANSPSHQRRVEYKKFSHAEEEANRLDKKKRSVLPEPQPKPQPQIAPGGRAVDYWNFRPLADSPSIPGYEVHISDRGEDEGEDREEDIEREWGPIADLSENMTPSENPDRIQVRNLWGRLSGIDLANVCGLSEGRYRILGKTGKEYRRADSRELVGALNDIFSSTGESNERYFVVERINESKLERKAEKKETPTRPTATAEQSTRPNDKDAAEIILHYRDGKLVCDEDLKRLTDLSETAVYKTVWDDGEVGEYSGRAAMLRHLGILAEHFYKDADVTIVPSPRENVLRLREQTLTVQTPRTQEKREERQSYLEVDVQNGLNQDAIGKIKGYQRPGKFYHITCLFRDAAGIKRSSSPVTGCSFVGNIEALLSGLEMIGNTPLRVRLEPEK